MADSPDPSPPRYVVVGGGDPTPEQIAALAVALTPVATPQQEPVATPAWLRAGLYEGVGLGIFSSPAELDLHAP